MGHCVELVSLIIYLQQLGHKFLGKSPWRLIGSGVTFYLPFARVRTDRPGRNPPSCYSSAHARPYLESSTLSFPCLGIRHPASICTLNNRLYESRRVILNLGTRA